MSKQAGDEIKIYDINHLNDPYWAEEDLRLLSLKAEHGYAILPETEKTTSMIKPSSSEEQTAKDFLA